MSPVGKRDTMGRFGATLKNVRWSWDAVMADGSIVFIAWDDEATRAADGALAEYRLVKDRSQPTSLPGASERRRHVEQLLASDAAGYLVLATAKDPDATPRQIESIDDHLYTVRMEERAAAVFAVVLASNSAPAADTSDDEPPQAATTAPLTEAQHLTYARRGQGLFRARVELIERGCRLTGVTDRAHLRASHIKPWRIATDAERLDGHNGLLLAPHVDHLFDRGFITFEDDGTLRVSSHLAPEVLAAWQLPVTASSGAFTPRQRAYLAHHRAEIFRASSS